LFQCLSMRSTLEKLART